MIDTGEFRKKIVFEKVTPGREADFADFPEEMLPEIRQFLEETGIRRLYSHQAEMFRRAAEGENVVVTTSTASGKTLGFLLPVLQHVLKDPLTRAIFLYPTKALASDQFRSLRPMLDHFGNRVRAGIYDGDTPPSERSRIRRGANIILTNPEMLNAAFLPNHGSYGFDFIFSNLGYIVLDELHSYRGAFGSHLANVLRRMGRVCRFHGSSPLFLCSSATIANPLELAGKICARPFSLVDRDGSPAPEKRHFLWQPPTARGTEFRISPAREATELIPKLVEGGSSFIAFCKSRSAVEVVLKESRDKLRHAGGNPGQDLSRLIAGYRGGYRPLERRAIEEQMAEGRLRGLVATNVLELGIDIGRLDTAVLVGFPGTRASFWQQAGRAGRKKGNAASVFLLLDNLPQDQYIAMDPGWLFSGSSENAVLDPDNLSIQIAHVRAAAAELPLSPDDLPVFPDLGEIVPVLASSRELRKERGKYYWSGGICPSGDFSLRNMDRVRFRLQNSEDGSVLTEMDELQAYREIYPGAVYMHEGIQYLVENLDQAGGVARARPADCGYYTVSCDVTEVRKIQGEKKVPLGRASCSFGDVRVAYTTLGFRRHQFHNHQNLGFGMLDHPLAKTFETEGFWISFPEEVRRFFLSLGPAKDGIPWAQFRMSYAEGLAFALANSAMMLTMATRDDVGSALLSGETESGPSLSVCVFDLYEGGLGFSDKAWSHGEEIAGNAVRMVEGCSCTGGCPACVGDYHLDKALVLWGLRSLFEALPPPDGVKRAPSLPSPPGRIFRLESLPGCWKEFGEVLHPGGEYLGRFLAALQGAEVRENTLVLPEENAFLREWLGDGANLRSLENLVRQYVEVPPVFSVELRTPGADSLSGSGEPPGAEEDAPGRTAP